jgi:hypothetical protein
MIILGILWVRTKNLEHLMWENNSSRNGASNMVILYIVYIGHLYGPEEVNYTCRKMVHRRTLGEVSLYLLIRAW